MPTLSQPLSWPSRTPFLPFTALRCRLDRVNDRPKTAVSTFIRKLLLPRRGRVDPQWRRFQSSPRVFHDQRAPRDLAPERALEQRVDLIFNHCDAALTLLALFPTRYRSNSSTACRPSLRRRYWRGRGRGRSGSRGRVNARSRCKHRRCSVQTTPLLRFTLQQRQTKSAREGPRELRARETRSMRV